MLRTSELWVGLAAALGTILMSLGFVDKEVWDSFLYPSIVYVVGRVSSKVAKKAGKRPDSVIGK